MPTEVSTGPMPWAEEERWVDYRAPCFAAHLKETSGAKEFVEVRRDPICLIH